MQPRSRILIGIHGLAEVGKTTAALILCQELELRRYIIAQPITQACAAALGITHEQFLAIPKNHVIEPMGITRRRMMQLMGDYLIHHNPRALINLLENRMAMDEGTSNFYNGELVEDVRTEEEAAWVRDRGGQMIHIRKTDAPKAPEHRTESGIAFVPGDIVVSNDSTQSDFVERLRMTAQLMRTHFGNLREAI